MKKYVLDIVPKIRKFSKKLDDVTLLIGQRWVMFNPESESKTTYIFQREPELLISINGKVKTSSWQYLDNGALILGMSEGSYLFLIDFFDEHILALRLDNEVGYLLLINETRSPNLAESLQAISFALSTKYLSKSVSDVQSSGASLANQTQDNGRGSLDILLIVLVAVAVVAAILPILQDFF